jgi:aspartyl protease family protein
MTEPEGPWGRMQADRRWRFTLWLGVVAAAIGAVWLLATLFPSNLDGSDWADVARGVGLVALISSGVVGIRRFNLSEKLRHLAVWVALVSVLVVGFTYRAELSDVGRRVRAELIPAYAVRTSPHEMVLTQGEGGGFFVMGQVNGAPVRFLIDTGASDIVLSPDDARRAGVDLAALNYSGVYETANGAGRGARVTADSLTVGQIQLSGVGMTVNQAPMSASLLGMTFLRRLDAFEVRGRTLILKWSG